MTKPSAPTLDSIVDKLILTYGDHIESDDDLSDWHIERPIIFQRELVKAKAALQQLLDQQIREALGQEHYVEAFGSTTGTGNKCACGKSFTTDTAIHGHIQWNLNRLAARGVDTSTHPSKGNRS